MGHNGTTHAFLYSPVSSSSPKLMGSLMSIAFVGAPLLAYADTDGEVYRNGNHAWAGCKPRHERDFFLYCQDGNIMLDSMRAGMHWEWARGSLDPPSLFPIHP